MQVELMKKQSKYIDKDGVEKTSTSFYVQCGETLIPVEPVYYHKKDEKGNEVKDLGYSGRKAVLSSFAATLPEKPKQ